MAPRRRTLSPASGIRLRDLLQTRVVAEHQQSVPQHASPNIAPGGYPSTPARRHSRSWSIGTSATLVAGSSFGWTGSEVVFTTTANGTERIVRYEPATDSWNTGPSARCPMTDPYYTQSAWFDGRYASGCVQSRLEIYTASTNRWTTIDAGASPFTSRAGSAIIWTGTELIAWSGTAKEAGNRTPNDGASIALGR